MFVIVIAMVMVFVIVIVFVFVTAIVIVMVIDFVIVLVLLSLLLSLWLLLLLLFLFLFLLVVCEFSGGFGPSERAGERRATGRAYWRLGHRRLCGGVHHRAADWHQGATCTKHMGLPEIMGPFWGFL